MKKTLWVAVALVAAAALIPLAGQAPQDKGRVGRGFGGAGMRGPGGPGPMAILQQLDLTDQQREQVKALMDERRQGQPGAKMQELQKQLHVAVFADPVDTANIEALKSAIGAAEAEMLAARIDVQVKIGQILTPEQRAKARQLIANAPARGRGRRGAF
jgi:protein CpxP